MDPLYPTVDMNHIFISTATGRVVARGFPEPPLRALRFHLPTPKPTRIRLEGPSQLRLLRESRRESRELGAMGKEGQGTPFCWLSLFRNRKPKPQKKKEKGSNPLGNRVSHSFEPSFIFKNQIRSPWCFVGFLVRRIPGQTGKGNPRNVGCLFD